MVVVSSDWLRRLPVLLCSSSYTASEVVHLMMKLFNCENFRKCGWLLSLGC